MAYPGLRPWPAGPWLRSGEGSGKRVECGGGVPATSLENALLRESRPERRATARSICTQRAGKRHLALRAGWRVGAGLEPPSWRQRGGCLAARHLIPGQLPRCSLCPTSYQPRPLPGGRQTHKGRAGYSGTAAFRTPIAASGLRPARRGQTRGLPGQRGLPDAPGRDTVPEALRPQKQSTAGGDLTNPARRRFD